MESGVFEIGWSTTIPEDGLCLSCIAGGRAYIQRASGRCASWVSAPARRV